MGKKFSSSVENYAQAIVEGLGEGAFRESDRGDPPRHHEILKHKGVLA